MLGGPDVSNRRTASLVTPRIPPRKRPFRRFSHRQSKQNDLRGTRTRPARPRRPRPLRQPARHLCRAADAPPRRRRPAAARRQTRRDQARERGGGPSAGGGGQGAGRQGRRGGCCGGGRSCQGRGSRNQRGLRAGSPDRPGSPARRRRRGRRAARRARACQGRPAPRPRCPRILAHAVRPGPRSIARGARFARCRPAGSAGGEGDDGGGDGGAQGAAGGSAGQGGRQHGGARARRGGAAGQGGSRRAEGRRARGRQRDPGQLGRIGARDRRPDRTLRQRHHHLHLRTPPFPTLALAGAAQVLPQVQARAGFPDRRDRPRQGRRRLRPVHLDLRLGRRRGGQAAPRRRCGVGAASRRRGAGEGAEGAGGAEHEGAVRARAGARQGGRALSRGYRWEAGWGRGGGGGGEGWGGCTDTAGPGGAAIHHLGTSIRHGVQNDTLELDVLATQIGRGAKAAVPPPGAREGVPVRQERKRGIHDRSGHACAGSPADGTPRHDRTRAAPK